MQKKVNTVSILIGCVLMLVTAISFQTPRIIKAEENAADELASTSDQQGKVLCVDAEGNVSYRSVENNIDREDLNIKDDEVFELKTLDEEGNADQTLKRFDSFQEAAKALKQQQRGRSGVKAAVFSDNQVRSAGASLVNFNTSSSTTPYTEDGTNVIGYLFGGSAADGAYLGTSSDGSKVKFKISGVVGWVSKNAVQIVPYTETTGYASFYRVEGGRLIHKISSDVHAMKYWSALDQGKAPNYLKDGVRYLSYDGNYFYTEDQFETMVSDYQYNSYQHAVNAGNPFYNYFQYLSYRSTTNFTAAMLDARTNSAVGSSTSKMRGLGTTFIDEQNRWGANAVLTYGIACNESAYGTSNYAINRNNLFGHAAYDYDPDGNASGYSSPAVSVRYHSQVFISNGYLNIMDYRYYGAHLGNKASGINVKYASDPYWGEKAAAQAHVLEQINGDKIDSYKSSIAIKDKSTMMRIYKEPQRSSKTLYTTENDNDAASGRGNVGAFPFRVLEMVSGESVNGNSNWYRIQSDAPLAGDRSSVPLSGKSYLGNGEYTFANCYGYINASYVDLVIEGDNLNNGVSFNKGDVNGDRKITGIDYVLIRNYLNGKSVITGAAAVAADVNSDSRISGIDYVLVRNHLDGKGQIQW